MLEHMSRNCTKDNETKSSFTSKLSFSADICVGLAILSVVFLSVMGNGIVLVICYRRRNKMVGSELLCVNLAVVDFLCCICFYPLSIISSFHHAWLGENVTCIYYGLGCYIFGLCGMFTIAAISIIRYLKICYSLVSELWLEKPNIRLVCCVIWLVSTVWSSFPLFGWGEYVPEPYGLSCTIAWRGYHTSAKDAFYVICSFVCFILTPMLFIVMSHCQTLYKISRFSSSLSARGIHNNLRRAEKRLSMMFFCISLGFVIAWMPYTIVSFLFIFHKEDHYMSPEGFVFPALFAKSSHVYNPFIYFYFNKTFQKELRSLLDIICPKMGRNRVSAHNALNIQAPDPIHIQLQERPHVHKIFALSRSCTQSKSKTSGKDTNGNHGLKRRVNTCWGSTPGRAPVILEEAKVNNPLPLSVTSV
ncbi:opsin 8, group member c isoform X1 [Corythoichthys intestinalis]|uniref:opsin 8, group member c isoform X1 n=1 Tax=Corythoichthys intestinalis TaxID=161448 RepID=UPI0025A5E029|nr:opsin 8, group member c isoform X1 [Corythoichthys intestinalis]XP_061806751.1 opsin-5-like [Nerophis lumbriciformis]